MLKTRPAPNSSQTNLQLKSLLEKECMCMYVGNGDNNISRNAYIQIYKSLTSKHIHASNNPKGNVSLEIMVKRKTSN